MNGTWKPRKTHDFIINERGKTRKIKAHHVQDRQIYKTYNRLVLKPAFENILVEENSASRTGKGTDYAIKRFKQDLAYSYKKCGNDFYVIIYDFRDYFNSVNHDVICDDLLPMIYESPNILDDYCKLFPNGVGIGGEPSQTVAIAYPHKLDRFLQCSQLVLKSGRYMDDGYVICRKKEDAKYILNKIYEHAKIMHLNINPKHTKICCMKSENVTFLKKRVRITDTGKILMHLTKNNVRTELKRIKCQSDNSKQLINSVIQSFSSWSSYALKYGAYYQVIKATTKFSKTFNISYEEVKKIWKKKS